MLKGTLVRPARQGDGDALEPRLGPESLAEHRACGSVSLELGVSLSRPCWAAEVGGRVEALFGVGPANAAWLLHSGELTPRQLAAHAPVWLARMLRERGDLWNVVPVGSVAERWLERLGAQIDSRVFAHGGLYFRKFILPASLLA